MRVKLKQLIKGIPSIEIKGSKDVDILGLCNNSKLAAPGFLFFAKKGLTSSGNNFIAEAALSGCVAVATDLFDPFLKNVVQIIHPDVAALESILSERFYSYPSRKLMMVGITGTNGKTTCSYLIKHLFDSMDLPAGLIGTIEWIVKDNVFPSNVTTPDIITNQKLLHEMSVVGCQSAVMEVSSHALSQGRVSSIDFDIAIFTNLTQDHLDYHRSMQEYAQSKSILFSSLGKKGFSGKTCPKAAIINQDSPWAQEITKDLSVRQISYGLSETAEVRADKIQLYPDGMEFLVSYKEKTHLFRSSLIGKFNVYNILATIATAMSLEWDFFEVLTVLSSFKAVPGRLERVDNPQGKNIFVDYAHTEDALKNVLETLKEIASGRLFCVFGCGGNRDRLKRPKMGLVAEQYADLVFVTSDNPRGELAESIIEEILTGIKHREKISIEVDRRKAIEKAVRLLNPDDVLLIAGKGHENYQVFSNHTIHFDDRMVAQESCLM